MIKTLKQYLSLRGLLAKIRQSLSVRGNDNSL